VKTPTPPTRAPHYVGMEECGWSANDCARGLISTLSSFARSGTDFVGNAKGHIWRAHEDATNARLAFSSDKGDGHIQLSIDAQDWVRAEVYVSGELKLRAWMEDPYEEKEFWPDGSDGRPDAKGDAPGRISKRGSWLQIRCADFPGVLPNEYGYWDAELPDLNVIVVDDPPPTPD
jgi:hypothetical protein